MLPFTRDLNDAAPTISAGEAALDRDSPPLNEDQLARFRARQIQTVLQLTPLTVLANVVNTGVVAVMFWRDGWRAAVSMWVLSIGGMLMLAMRAWLRSRRSSVARRCSPRVERRSVEHAGLLSGFWALMPAALLPVASSAEQGLIGCISVAMICAGGFALSSIPVAGMVFAASIGLGTAVGIVRTDGLPHGLLLLMLVFYVLTVLLSVRWTAASFRARLVAEVAAERERDVVGLLLNDFENHASDALWEIDAKGRFSHVSPRLCSMLGKPAPLLIGQPVTAVFLDATEVVDAWIELNGEAADSSLQGRLKNCEPFHGLVLSFERADGGDEVAGEGRRGWVQLAAKPLIDDRGQHSGWRGVVSNVTREHEAQRHITQLAFKDAITGLHNRHSFQIRLGQMVAQEGAERPCAVVCMDLDGFKTVNDALGHDIGDALLKSVADRLAALLLPCDLFARLGGDEFGFILDGVTSEDEAAGRAAQLLDALRTPLAVQGASVPIGASLGVALVPRDGTRSEVILKHADLALYAAKAGGRGQYRFFLPDMGAKVLHRLSIERALRDALRDNQLSLAYQPQVDLRDGVLLGFEALLRWHHPELGTISPADFVPVAEDAGLIGDIGEWVLRRACEDAKHWTQPLRVAVNLSPLQIMAQDLHGVVARALRDAGLPASRLEVEVTESVLLNEASSTLAQLHALHSLGVRIALDDFGTGYSSMAYLRRFPFDKLKIDRAFVGELVDRADARAIVRAMLELGRALKMDTVAEGVENLAELHELHALGCEAVQGYFVARPMPENQVESFVARWPTHASHAAMLQRIDEMVILG